MGEDALLATYDLETALADGSTTKGSGTQLYVSANGKLYVVTVTLTDGDSEDAKADPRDGRAAALGDRVVDRTIHLSRAATVRNGRPGVPPRATHRRAARPLA